MFNSINSGFEIDGLEKIPDAGAALIVYYHGTLPIDFYYLAARCLLEKKRHIRAVGDNFLFHIPGKQMYRKQINQRTCLFTLTCIKDKDEQGWMKKKIKGVEKYMHMYTCT